MRKDERNLKSGMKRLADSGEDVFAGPDFSDPLRHGFLQASGKPTECSCCGCPRDSHHFDSIVQRSMDAFAADDSLEDGTSDIARLRARVRKGRTR